MIINLAISAGRVAIDSLRDQRTGQDIEEVLNNQLVGENWHFENYEGDDVSVLVESIKVRPKYTPKKVAGGIMKVEGDNYFTEFDKERLSPTFKERFNAVLKDKWITVVRLKIQNGDADQIRPPGLSLGYVTSTTSMRFAGYTERHYLNPIPQIRVAETHELQSDKLEMKVRYDGSIGEYRDRVSDSIDLLKEVQENMDSYVLQYLCELHHSVDAVDKTGFSGESAERARQLGEYLLGHPVKLNKFEESIRQLKEVIEADRNDS